MNRLETGGFFFAGEAHDSQQRGESQALRKRPDQFVCPNSRCQHSGQKRAVKGDDASPAGLSANMGRGGLDDRLSSSPLRGVPMPESGLPIRVYKEDDMWHVDYGDGLVRDFATREEAESAADAVAQAEGRTVVVEE